MAPGRTPPGTPATQHTHQSRWPASQPPAQKRLVRHQHRQRSTTDRDGQPNTNSVPLLALPMARGRRGSAPDCAAAARCADAPGRSMPNSSASSGPAAIRPAHSRQSPPAQPLASQQTKHQQPRPASRKRSQYRCWIGQNSSQLSPAAASRLTTDLALHVSPARPPAALQPQQHWREESAGAELLNH